MEWYWIALAVYLMIGAFMSVVGLIYLSATEDDYENTTFVVYVLTALIFTVMYPIVITIVTLKERRKKIDEKVI